MFLITFTYATRKFSIADKMLYYTMTGSASSCLVNKLLVKDRNLRDILFLIKSKYKPANRTFIYIISIILQKDSS